MVEVAEEE